MSMRNFLVSFLLILSFHGLAQKLSISFEGGYQHKLATAKKWDGKPATDQFGNSGLGLINYSLGQGMIAGTEIMYRLNPNWQVGLGVNYLIGSKMEFWIGDTFQSKMLRLIPQANFRINHNKVSPFFSSGFIVGFGQIISSRDYGDIVSKRSKGLSFGFKNSFGVDIQTNTRINFFIKTDIYTQSYGPKQSEKIVWGKDFDLLPSKTVSEIFVDYVDSIGENEIQDPNKPSKALRRFYPFSSIGVNLGLVIRMFGQ